MSDEAPVRRYRFAQRRRAGLFGALPPALVGVGLAGLAVAGETFASNRFGK